MARVLEAIRRAQQLVAWVLDVAWRGQREELEKGLAPGGTGTDEEDSVPNGTGTEDED